MRPRLLRFEEYELDLESSVLFRDGEVVRLPMQPFTVLRTLVLSEGRVVGREELKRAVWKDGTHVDFEGSLHSCVKQVRGALGDDAAHPRFIETLPRRGYRFLPVVEPVPPAAARTPGRRSARGWLALASAALLVALAESDRPSKPGAARNPPLTLLVSAFDNETGDPSLEYLGRAIADEVRDRLGALDPSELVVLAPRTTELFGSSGSRPAVDYELAGSIHGSGRAPVLEVDLRRCSDGARLWGDRVEAGDRVSRVIAALVPHLVPGEATSLPRETASDVASAANEAYWKGRYLSKENDGESLARAERSYRDAIALRGNWAAPLVGLAELQLRRAMSAGDGRAYAEAAETAARSIELEPSGDAQFVIALASWFGTWNWTRAGEAFQRAILRSPGLARVHHWYAYYLTGLGRHREAIFEIERARRLDPLSAQVQSDVSWFYYFAGRYPEAIEASRRTLDLEPSFLLAQDCLIESYLALGRHEEALSEAKRFLDLSKATEPGAGVDGWDSFWKIRLASAERAAGRVDSYEAAIAALRLDREAEAIRWLGRAVEERNLWLPMLAIDPRFSKAAADPALERLRGAIGLGTPPSIQKAGYP